MDIRAYVELPEWYAPSRGGGRRGGVRAFAGVADVRVPWAVGGRGSAWYYVGWG
jgi:hypothetical protein